MTNAGRTSDHMDIFSMALSHSVMKTLRKRGVLHANSSTLRQVLTFCCWPITLGLENSLIFLKFWGKNSLYSFCARSFRSRSTQNNALCLQFVALCWDNLREGQRVLNNVQNAEKSPIRGCVVWDAFFMAPFFWWKRWDWGLDPCDPSSMRQVLWERELLWWCETQWRRLVRIRKFVGFLEFVLEVTGSYRKFIEVILGRF